VTPWYQSIKPPSGKSSSQNDIPTHTYATHCHTHWFTSNTYQETASKAVLGRHIHAATQAYTCSNLGIYMQRHWHIHAATHSACHTLGNTHPLREERWIRWRLGRMATLVERVRGPYILQYTHIFEMGPIWDKSTLNLHETCQLYTYMRQVLQHLDTSYSSWSKETIPPGGVSYLLYSLIKNREIKDPPWITTPKID